jgi:hypothetical protein
MSGKEESWSCWSSSSSTFRAERRRPRSSGANAPRHRHPPGWRTKAIPSASGEVQALVGAAGEHAGALLLGTLGGVLLAGLDAGLDAAANDRVGALLGEQVVLLEPRPRHPGRQQLDDLTAADPAPLLGRRGADRAGEVLVELKERAGLLGPHATRRGGAGNPAGHLPAPSGCQVTVWSSTARSSSRLASAPRSGWRR